MTNEEIIRQLENGSITIEQATKLYAENTNVSAPVVESQEIKPFNPVQEVTDWIGEGLRGSRNESLNREKFAFDYEQDSGGINLPFEEKPIDWIGGGKDMNSAVNDIQSNVKVNNFNAKQQFVNPPIVDDKPFVPSERPNYDTWVDRSKKVASVDITADPWVGASPEEKANFIKWKTEQDRGIPSALFHSPEGSLLGKGLRALGVTEQHPSGYQYQPKGITENITYGLGGMAVDLPAFKAGGMLGNVMGKAIPGVGKVANTAREMLTSGMQFAPHSAAVSAVDDINAGNPIDAMKALKAFGTGMAMGAGVPLVTNAVEKIASGAAKSVFDSNIQKAIERKP
jgi:hypothetical protein